MQLQTQQTDTFLRTSDENHTTLTVCLPKYKVNPIAEESPRHERDIFNNAITKQMATFTLMPCTACTIRIHSQKEPVCDMCLLWWHMTAADCATHRCCVPKYHLWWHLFGRIVCHLASDTQSLWPLQYMLDNGCGSHTVVAWLQL